MNKEQYNELKVVKNEIPYGKVVDYINFVVANSYAKNDGKYHEYLMDYSEAVAIITMYTDCNDYNFDFNDVMMFIQSEKWNKIKEELGDAYIYFHYYVKKEIEYNNTPLRYADNAMQNISNAVSKINEVLNSIDVEALKNYDFSKIMSAIDNVSEAENSNIDNGNIVEFSKDKKK